MQRHIRKDKALAAKAKKAAKAGKAARAGTPITRTICAPRSPG